MKKTPKLSRPLKTKWCKALRSGEYKQATGALCKMLDSSGTKIGHCCLGVLAELTGVPRQKMIDAGMCDLNDARKKHLLGDIDDDNLAYGDNADVTSVQRYLADMNDGGTSFRRIATWIDKNL